MTEQAQTSTARATAAIDRIVESCAARMPANDNATMLDAVAGMQEAARRVATAARLSELLAADDAEVRSIEAEMEAALNDAYRTLLKVYAVLDALHEERCLAGATSS
ncbi:MAG: hypothetical protein AB7P50_22505 [Alphaproteobacteria bacterium]